MKRFVLVVWQWILRLLGRRMEKKSMPTQTTQKRNFLTNHQFVSRLDNNAPAALALPNTTNVTNLSNVSGWVIGCDLGGVAAPIPQVDVTVLTTLDSEFYGSIPEASFPEGALKFIPDNTPPFTPTADPVADTKVFVRQTVSGNFRLSGEYAVFSFFAKASSVADVAGIVRASIDGGSTYVVAGSRAFRLTTSWARYAVTVKLPTADSASAPGNFKVEAGIYLHAGGNSFEPAGTSIPAGLVQESGEVRIDKTVTYYVSAAKLEAGNVVTEYSPVDDQDAVGIDPVVTLPVSGSIPAIRMQGSTIALDPTVLYLGPAALGIRTGAIHFSDGADKFYLLDSPNGIADAVASNAILAGQGPIQLLDATGGNLSLSLITPPNATNVAVASRVREIFFLKRTDATANTVTVTPLTGTIDGAANITLAAHAAAILWFDGTNWHKLN